MNKMYNQALRFVFDLQSTQVLGSSTRGVGRYSCDFFKAVYEQHTDLFAVLNSSLDIFPEFPYLSASRILNLPNFGDWKTGRDYNGGDQDAIDAMLYSSVVAPIKSDVIHVSHVFEGLNDRIPLPCQGKKALGQISSATLYDLIPLRFQHYYFKNDIFKKWYLHRLNWLKNADLLLAISESTRQDAIQLLGIDPSRVVTIHGGVSSHFYLPQHHNSSVDRLRNKYALRKPFILYTGGDEYRKNIQGMIQGYAALPKDLRNAYQLVIICEINSAKKKFYHSIAEKEGIEKDDLVFTGFVSDEDLACFYTHCELFVFPSLYEGFGLPILEAMACGAPVIGSDNSSVGELINFKDALFNASSVNSIAEVMARVLRDESIKKALREHSKRRIKDFSWKSSAAIAIDAFNEAVSRKNYAGVSAALGDWLPRKRLAFFSPMPPCKSGIADYNAKFLPYLSRYFDIDIYVDNYKVDDQNINSSFRIYNASDFEPVAHSYDVLFYEFGNSEFHVYMLPIFEKYPGIVGLHDAYLSGLFSYMDFNLGFNGKFYKEMIYSHGSNVRSSLIRAQSNPTSVHEIVVNFPCTKWVIDNALGIISHSPYNLEIARRHFPQGWLGPYRVIPQMIGLPEHISHDKIKMLKTKLGFADDDFIIATFGHIFWTKMGDLFINSFLQSYLSKDPRVNIVFVGELAQDDFRSTLIVSIKQAALDKRIRITGYLKEEDYKEYLCIADLAFQLRKDSRGGTPRGVLDCLAHGVPVIVNNDASYTDYPDDVVIKLPAKPTEQDLRNNLEILFENNAKRKAYGSAGKSYVEKFHNPLRCAAQYAIAIHEFMNKQELTKQDAYVSSLAPLLASSLQPVNAIRTVTEILNQTKSPCFTRQRLFIDVSHVTQSDQNTGIQRVVNKIVFESYQLPDSMLEPCAVELKDGKLIVAHSWLKKKKLLLNHEDNDCKDIEVSFNPGDVLLMLDSSWEHYEEFYKAFEAAKSKHVPIYTVIYDLLPLTLPHGMSIHKNWFENWLSEAAIKSDGLICISKSVAEELINWTLSKKRLRKNLKIGYWHLGSDILVETELAANMRESRLLKAKINPCLSDKKYLLMVGTIEPRKSHPVALEAMEQLWEEDNDLCLCITGKQGWASDHFIQKMSNHPQINKKLFFIESATDAEVANLYRNAAALLFISIGEGFGLPLVEAANYGIPILCSDIPVFREIAGDFATYLNIESASIVAKQIKAWYEDYCAGEVLKTSSMPRLTWQQSAMMLHELILKNNWYWRI